MFNKKYKKNGQYTSRYRLGYACTGCRNGFIKVEK